ncbi:Tetratricopeptide-like helical containing protein [Cricetulus griseus]|nr:Tetratricopeptide-like helical containing protein [Cricetulus griseus]
MQHWASLKQGWLSMSQAGQRAVPGLDRGKHTDNLGHLSGVMEHGAWSMEHGAWSMEHGAWSMEHGAWRELQREKAGATSCPGAEVLLDTVILDWKSVGELAAPETSPPHAACDLPGSHFCVCLPYEDVSYWGASTCDPGDSTNAKRQVCYSVAADLEKTHGGDAETSRLSEQESLSCQERYSTTTVTENSLKGDIDCQVKSQESWLDRYLFSIMVLMKTKNGSVETENMMSAQKLVACLCQEGDKHLALGELPLATAFYLAAFSCHAPSATRHVRAVLAEAPGAPVVATLEAWCRGDSQIPNIHWDGMAVVSLTGPLASAFLGAIYPDHPATVLYLLAGLLAHGRHEEVVQRCNALLDAHSQQTLELQLTRALARVLSVEQANEGITAYLQGFASSADRTVAFIHSHQQPYLPTLLGTLQNYLLGHLKATGSTTLQETNCWELLEALDPRGSWVDAVLPKTLLHRGRFEDCLAACSRNLQPDSTGRRPQGEHLAALLVTRAAAAFFLDNRAGDMLLDLQEAFRESPAAAQRHFQALLSAEDRERVQAQAQEAADMGFSRFLEAVRSRPELREDADRDLLVPVTHALHVLLRVAPARRRPTLGIRLAECLLLAGDVSGARAQCERLLRPRRSGERVGHRTGDLAQLLALRGFCALHTGDARRAREDFQEVVERGAPHAGGCVRALCGRGLLRVLEGSAFLGALDYVTACRLRPEEALLVAKAYVPWNQRGLLLTVLREEGRRMLLRSPGCVRKAAQGVGPAAQAQEGDAYGVYQLAMLLMELDAEDETSCLLVADALYLLGHLDDAHKSLLIALSRRPQAAPVLVRLALLQLRRGFCYDVNQLVKKVAQSGDTACLQHTLDIFHHEDLKLLQGHCHTRALSILRAQPGGPDSEAHTREAITYLSLAIFATGSQASESLLTRARCYGLLGQKKTAMFDFNSVLRQEPRNVQALCGRALVHLALDQIQEAVDDMVSALKLDPGTVISEIHSLKPEVQLPLTQGLHAHCQVLLNQWLDAGGPVREEDTQSLLAMGEALIRIDATQPSWNLLLTDILTALGKYQEAGTHLQEALKLTPSSEAAQARRGLLQLKKGDVSTATHDLQCLAETDTKDLSFLLRLLQSPERQSLTQASAKEASNLLGLGQPGRALGYCSLAVLAGGSSPYHLRLRTACLTQLQEYGRALRDLDRVLQEGAGDSDLPRRTEDFCSRGRLLLNLGDKDGAAGAFTQALALSPAQAQSSLSKQPGHAPTASVFLAHGQHCLEQQRYEEAWTAAQNGLLMDPSHSGLKRLKARTRREVSSGCRLH